MYSLELVIKIFVKRQKCKLYGHLTNFTFVKAVSILSVVQVLLLLLKSTNVDKVS